MKPAPFVYHRPASLPDALALLERYGAEGRVLAGGQSLVPALNMRLATPGALIDINRIPGLDEIRLGAEGLVLGALAWLRDQKAGRASPRTRRSSPRPCPTSRTSRSAPAAPSAAASPTPTRPRSCPRASWLSAEPCGR